MGIAFVQISYQIVFIRAKTLSKTHLAASRDIKKQKSLLPVDVRGSIRPLLKLQMVDFGQNLSLTTQAIPKIIALTAFVSPFSLCLMMCGIIIVM